LLAVWNSSLSIPVLLEIFKETDRDDRLAFVAGAAYGPQTEIYAVRLPALGFYFLLYDREGYGLRAAFGQLDGEGCQPQHVSQPAVVILAEASLGFGRGQAVVERFADGHWQLETNFFAGLCYIDQGSVGKGLGACIGVEDWTKKWAFWFG
jgi:hypothetical protein